MPGFGVLLCKSCSMARRAHLSGFGLRLESRVKFLDWDPELVSLYFYNALAAVLFYVSLAVNQLSDAMEAYLVALCSVQLAMDTQRCLPSSSWLETLFSHVQLDISRPRGRFGRLPPPSQHLFTSPLLLWLVSAGVTKVVNPDPEMAEARGRRIVSTVASFCHLAFPIVVISLAANVEGSYLDPMLFYLLTAFTIFWEVTAIQYYVAFVH